MKAKLLKLITIMLTLAMLAGVFAACGDSNETGTTETETKGTESETKTGDTETESETKTGDTEETQPQNGSESTTEKTTEESEEETIVAAEGEYGKTITLAKKLSGTVNASYSDQRRTATISNKNAIIVCPLSNSSAAGSGAITTPDGKVYVPSVSRPFVQNTEGNIFWSSESGAIERMNIYRLGSYYYEVHMLDGMFANYDIIDEVEIRLSTYRSGNGLGKIKYDKDANTLTYTIKDTNDPYLSGGTMSHSTEKYNAFAITIATSDSSTARIYFTAGKYTSFNDKQTVEFSLIPDGELHTYYVPMNNVPDFTGNITNLRLDVGSKVGEVITISDMRLVSLSASAPMVKLDRTYHLYSDKVNEVIRLVASEDVSDLASFGAVTDISADTVEKIIIKDKNGTHDTLNGVDFASVEYVAFDIKDVGIFGYILVPDETSGSLHISLDNGVYVITQEYTLPAGTVVKELKEVKSAHRIYTDENHTFDAFLKAAEEERNPLTDISVPKNNYGATYVKYDPFRGAYYFDVKGYAGFQAAYDNPQQRYNLSINFNGGSEDRAVYIISHTKSGNLESGAIISKDGLMLPIDLEVCKNFGGEHEEPFYDDGDTTYGEIIFPYVVEAEKTNSFHVVNLYQNWGNFPLKQISSIQFIAPYYHLSYGTTETNCIAPYYVYGKDYWTLPDFRAMSAPLWSNQPQHTSIGRLYFLKYTNSEGQFYGSESIDNKITSYGPTYCDIDMNYLSDDGKIEAYYRHMEMPHSDENRTYYELVLEVKEDLSIKDFKNDFSFFSFDGRNPYFKQMGYLNENNECVITSANTSTTPKYYTLGDKSPYISYFDGPETNNPIEYVNFALVIKNYSFTVGGEAYDGNLIFRDVKSGNLNEMSLTLDLGEITLKKGDKFVINMILLPWGDPYAENDDNVRNVRQDACLDPYKLDVTVGEEIADEYLPQVMSENGVAEFTLSGGTDNCVVRVYGYDKLTVPTVMEKVNGSWVEYTLHSEVYKFDGYTVYYDGDGTYSYAFVINMDGGKARTFKVTADKEFKPLEEGFIDGENTVLDELENLPLNVYVTPANKIAINASMTYYGCSVTTAKDNSYFRFTGNSAAVEAYVTPISDLMLYETTGQYVVFKYRIPTTNTAKNNRFEIFTSTKNYGASAADYISVNGAVIEDGEWHVVIVDVSTIGTFVPDENGEYHANYFRIDIFNMSDKVPTNCYIDIAYFGMSDNLEDICALNKDMDTLMLFQKGAITEINPADYAE